MESILDNIGSSMESKSETYRSRKLGHSDSVVKRLVDKPTGEA